MMFTNPFFYIRAHKMQYRYETKNPALHVQDGIVF